MGRRPQRLAEGIREEVAKIVASELKDPRLGFVTITRVELTSDLSHAKVHFGVLGGDKERESTLAALRSATGFVRREVGRRLRIYHAPEIDFRYDKGLDATERVARLLNEAQAEAASAGEAGGSPDGAARATPERREDEE